MCIPLQLGSCGRSCGGQENDRIHCLHHSWESGMITARLSFSIPPPSGMKIVLRTLLFTRFDCYLQVIPLWKSFDGSFLGEGAGRTCNKSGNSLCQSHVHLMVAFSFALVINLSRYIIWIFKSIVQVSRVGFLVPKVLGSNAVCSNSFIRSKLWLAQRHTKGNKLSWFQVMDHDICILQYQCLRYEWNCMT